LSLNVGLEATASYRKSVSPNPFPVTNSRPEVE